jgi:hypothetical protein
MEAERWKRGGRKERWKIGSMEEWKNERMKG